jgi:alpha-galactosidase
LLTEHPGWFLPRGDGGGMLNLGNPDARKGITEIVSNLITQGGIDWYRGDFNIDPFGLWARADLPNRVGMTEIQYVEGLYAFWDDLRAQHPGLEIDNCASGGRRIDLETISRSVALWRSDYPCSNLDPIAPQLETQGLAPWVPLSGGCCEGYSDYAVRSAYSPALVIDEGCNMVIPRDDAWLKSALEEFHRARPYFYGDYYSLLSYTPSPENWSAVQFDRPDLQGGVAIFLRREQSPFTSIQANLRKIDPGATYSVEVRGALGPATPARMAGKELANLTITIPAKPGSAVVFYERQ